MSLVSDNIREIMYQRHITQNQLAESIGIMQPSLSRMLKQNNFSSGNLEKIAAELGVPVLCLFSGTQNLSYADARDMILSLTRSLTSAECQDLGCLLINEGYKRSTKKDKETI